jgi:N6-adenosine-specific RNA methylase IME4
MTVEEICREPVEQLVMKNAHLHLWTTNAFLREAFDVMHAWGFQYKSCLIWIKPQLGMGNYWRVSHEYLLLGIRGSLPFRDHACPSWLPARRTIHSRKPLVFREMVEQVSPGPYLELYGREEPANAQWTVYGDQVKQLLF